MDTLEKFLICAAATIREAMLRINEKGTGIVVIVDDKQRLVGTLTDGDFRRAVLSGRKLDESLQVLLDAQAEMGPRKPLTACVGTPDSELLHLMNSHVVRQIPVVDEEDRLVNVVMLSDLVKEYEKPLSAVIMAGGFGLRMHPLTAEMPKPMLPVGDRPLLEHTIEHLRESGIRQINITTHFKPEKITQHFGDGKGFGVDLNYVSEEAALGTAGSLGLMAPPGETVVVVNGDILTGVNYRAMRHFHQDHKADMTVGVRYYEFSVPYGVVESDGVVISRINEKPALSFFVNAGIYLLEPLVFQYITPGQHLDMTELIAQLIRDGRRVVSFPISEYWLDVGRPVDYERANQDMRQRSSKP